MDRSAAPFHWRALVALLSRLPQGAISRLTGRLADIRLPRRLRRPILGAFARVVGVDLDEAERSLQDYPTVDAFFVRRLRPGLRPMAEDPQAVVSPVDGRVAEVGPITGGRLLQVKGISYDLTGLLGDAEEAARYEPGHFMTIYLSPKDYHRIHAPCTGRIPWARHEPGRLFPVNRPSSELVPDLFARNERLICAIDGAVGRIAVVAVAAFNVGRISSQFDRSWNDPTGGVSNRPRAEPTARTYEPPLEISRGDELMVFHLGSTIVLVGADPALRPRTDLRPGDAVRMGQALT